MFIPHYVSCVTCHLSRVTCHVSPVTCHLSPVTCHLSPVKCEEKKKITLKTIGNICGASRWRVCYQWVLPHLVFAYSIMLGKKVGPKKKVSVYFKQVYLSINTSCILVEIEHNLFHWWISLTHALSSEPLSFNQTMLYPVPLFNNQVDFFTKKQEIKICF